MMLKKIPCDVYEINSFKGLFTVTFKNEGNETRYDVEYNGTERSVISVFCYGSTITEDDTHEEVLERVAYLIEDTDYFDFDIELHKELMEE